MIQLSPQAKGHLYANLDTNTIQGGYVVTQTAGLSGPRRSKLQCTKRSTERPVERTTTMVQGWEQVQQAPQKVSSSGAHASATFDFRGANAVVIGASRGGIGSAIALSLSDAGAHVAITGAEPEPARGLEKLDYAQLDVTDADAVEAYGETKPELDVLINCAAITRRGEEMEPAFFSHVLDVNLTGSFRCAHTMHRALSRRNGRVVNIASMYSRFGSPRNPGYGASKAGIEQLTKSLAIAWAPDKIRVNAVAPGFIVTEQSARARQDPAFTAAVEERTPLGRWGQPSDLVGTALFLASEASAFLTGACIPVDGGYSVV
ncbi:MAG: SDR family oxidoreductase [Pseudomonadota bacterium]